LPEQERPKDRQPQQHTPHGEGAGPPSRPRSFARQAPSSRARRRANASWSNEAATIWSFWGTKRSGPAG